MILPYVKDFIKARQTSNPSGQKLYPFSFFRRSKNPFFDIFLMTSLCSKAYFFYANSQKLIENGGSTVAKALVVVES